MPQSRHNQFYLHSLQKLAHAMYIDIFRCKKLKISPEKKKIEDFNMWYTLEQTRRCGSGENPIQKL